LRDSVSEAMKTEKEIEFLDLLREFDRREIRFLIIGRRAVVLHGAPVLTADYDLWIHPEDKKKTLLLLSDELDFELSQPPETRRPIVTAFCGMKKYDLFFHRSVRTIEFETVDFGECYRNSVVREDASERIRFRIPSIDDLIRLKKIRKPNAKDQQDIEYLLNAKRLLK